jgi:hypothetical protein
MRTGHKNPKVGNPIMFRRKPMISVPMGTRRRMRKVLWNSGELKEGPPVQKVAGSPDRSMESSVAHHLAGQSPPDFPKCPRKPERRNPA